MISLWRRLAMIVPYPFFPSPNGQSRAEKLSKKPLSGVSSTKIAVISQRNEPSLLCFVGFYAFVVRLARLFRQFQKVNSANFALKLSEKPHERANLLAIRRLIAA